VVSEVLAAPPWLPAAGQGAVAVVCRAQDEATLELLQGLDHQVTRAEVTAERAFLRALEGGCQIPLGAFARTAGTSLTLSGFVAGVHSGELLRGERQGSSEDPGALGTALAAELRARGADRLLAEARSGTGATPAVTPP
jgi:hydroxymethylbilane synthase